jgi:hypothetical protein
MIPFKRGGGWATADEDRRVFRLWERELITTREAALMIARNNDLDYLPSDQEFIQTAWALGYGRYGEED